MSLKLNIRLNNLNPAIERTIVLDEDTTFAQFHDLLQLAFAWENSHIHQFLAEPQSRENVIDLFGKPKFSIITDPQMFFDATTEPYDEALEVNLNSTVCSSDRRNWSIARQKKFGTSCSLKRDALIR